MEWRTIIGKNIKRERKEKHFTQEQLAKKIGKSKRTIQNYEAGETDIPQSAFFAIVEALEIGYTHLLAWDDSLLKAIINLEEKGFSQQAIAKEFNIHPENILFDDSIDNILSSSLGEVDYIINTYTGDDMDVFIRNISFVAKNINEEGREKVLDYAVDISHNPYYQKER